MLLHHTTSYAICLWQQQSLVRVHHKQGDSDSDSDSETESESKSESDLQKAKAIADTRAEINVNKL